MMLALRPVRGGWCWLTRLNLLLVAVRLGVLFGTGRAYVERPWTY
jgi:hypothetical protein